MNTQLNSKSRFFLLLTLAVSVFLVVLSSCSHNGYGCHGRSKYITRVR